MIENSDVKTFLLQQPGIAALVGSRVFDNVVSPSGDTDSPEFPYIWFSLRGMEQDDCLAYEGEMQPEALLYDVELYALNHSHLFGDGGLIDEIRKLHRYGVDGNRAFGTGKAHYVNVADQTDDYLFRGAFQDAAESVAFDLEIAPYYG